MNTSADLKQYGDIVYVSKFMNVIGMIVAEDKIHQLQRNHNVISVKESAQGEYQTIVYA